MKASRYYAAASQLEALVGETTGAEFREMERMAWAIITVPLDKFELYLDWVTVAVRSGARLAAHGVGEGCVEVSITVVLDADECLEPARFVATEGI